jgi:aspartate ammonia-lyase
MRSSKNSSKISETSSTPSLNPVMKYNDISRIERKALFEQKNIDKVVHKKLSLSSL